MPDRRNYLRDRGLADQAETPQPAPFHVNLDTGLIESADPEQPVVPRGVPDDYPARLLAVQYGVGAAVDSVDDTMTFIHRLHAFLTATEKPRDRVHTDN